MVKLGDDLLIPFHFPSPFTNGEGIRRCTDPELGTKWGEERESKKSAINDFKKCPSWVWENTFYALTSSRTPYQACHQ
jgi:hypothetical protein